MPVTYVTFAASGRQYRVKNGDNIIVNRMAVASGESVKLDNVLLVEHDDGAILVGADAAKFSLTAKVTEHMRGDKIRVFKMRRRKASRRTAGHRQDLTRLSIDEINAG